MEYEKAFDWRKLGETARPVAAGENPYVYDDDIELAVNVALAAQRPLLVAGPPGTGKSSLAPDVARLLGRRFYRKVISSRTEARDLLWSFDALARLRDAQANRTLDGDYVDAGVLWQAFDQESARGHTPDEQEGDNAVVLLDEIDKADPDVPNDLLVPLGDSRFLVTDLDLSVAAKPPGPLVVMTTNDERELPAAFTRRCIVLVLEPPPQERYVAIAEAHFGGRDAQLHRELASLLFRMAAEATERRIPPPSTAEYIDAIRACTELGVDTGHPAWTTIAETTLRKRRDIAVT